MSLANVVSAAVVVAELGRTMTALGLMGMDSRPAGRCTGAWDVDKRVLPTDGAPLEDGRRNEPFTTLIVVASGGVEGACFVAVSAEGTAGMVKVVSAMGNPCEATVVAVGEPPLAMTNDSPRAGNGGVPMWWSGLLAPWYDTWR